jgi:hypothetical protein
MRIISGIILLLLTQAIAHTCNNVAFEDEIKDCASSLGCFDVNLQADSPNDSSFFHPQEQWVVPGDSVMCGSGVVSDLAMLFAVAVALLAVLLLQLAFYESLM